MDIPKAELDAIVRNYVNTVQTLCHYELALHTIANMGRDNADDAHTIARKALDAGRERAKADNP